MYKEYTIKILAPEPIFLDELTSAIEIGLREYELSYYGNTWCKYAAAYVHPHNNKEVTLILHAQPEVKTNSNREPIK